MGKRILIDTSKTEETRIAVTTDEKLDDYEIESEKQIAVKGNVYLAKITRVEPSLQAAFVDFGSNRNGFLPLTEIHPDYFKIPVADQEKLSILLKNLRSENNEEDKKNNEIDETVKKDAADQYNDENDIEKKINLKDPRKEYINFFRKYKIQDVIKPRQVLLVQVSKEERGFKGAALTTFLSFAGRYCVLMPNSLNNDGISRKIGDIEERKKLKTILSSVNVPENMSVIVRTAGIGKTKKEISKDLSYLTNQWNKIRENTIKSQAPSLIYEEGTIIKRVIRDLLTDDVEEILVEGKDGYDTTKKLTKNIVPTKVSKIKLYKGKEKSLFSEHNVENQINELFSLSVKLQSGGSIVINTTEALVAIDVNSGKNTSERNIENTALKTNLEAATEVARQLRLRDLGGLVVIDFIDMDDYRNNFKVEKATKNALFKDRARVQVGRISMFGLLELSRQRLRSSLIDRSFEKCPYCNGTGLILNTNSISEQIIKLINEKLISNKTLKIQVKCNSALAETLMNEKRIEINKLEEKYNSKILFDFDNHYSLHEPVINEIEDQKVVKIKSKSSEKNSLKKKTKNSKKNIKIKPKVKKKVTKEKSNKLIKKKKINTDTSKDEIEVTSKNIDKISKKNDDEKSGWWSE